MAANVLPNGEEAVFRYGPETRGMHRTRRGIELLAVAQRGERRENGFRCDAQFRIHLARGAHRRLQAFDSAQSTARRTGKSPAPRFKLHAARFAQCHTRFDSLLKRHDFN